MADNFTSVIPNKRIRVNSDEENTDLASHSSNNSRDNGEKCIPEDLSCWTEQQLQRLSIVTTHEEHTTPSELLDMFPLEFPRSKNKLKYFMPTHMDDIEHFFCRWCWFHAELDTDFASLLPVDAEALCDDALYCADRFFAHHERDSMSQLHHWFRRFESCGVNFGKKLYNMTMRKRLKATELADDKMVVEPLQKYDFQLLFDAFVSMFGLQNHDWCEPLMPLKTLTLSEVKVKGKADIIYARKVPCHVTGNVTKHMQIVAVCKVKKEGVEVDHQQQECRVTTGSQFCTSSSQHSSLPPHIPVTLLGEHGGQLLTYYEHSIKNDVIFGLIVQETKVTFTALQITHEQYNDIISGKQVQSPANLIITKPYDFMKKKDREYLIKPLLKLALMQEVCFVS